MKQPDRAEAAHWRQHIEEHAGLHELHQEAARAYRRAARSRPDEVRAHLGLARAAVQLGRRQAALKAFESAKRHGPDDPAVLEFAREFSR